jgi:hypothetical protein
MGNHIATAEQWATVGGWPTAECRCLLELRARVEALEAHAQQQQPAPRPTGLVEQVRQAIEAASIEQEPRAAIRAVAAWLRSQTDPSHHAWAWAMKLEQEAAK